MEALVREAGHVPAGREIVRDEPDDIHRAARAALARPDVDITRHDRRHRRRAP
ncbi:MAG: hypothetical protein R2752_02965 [Vicinamibacterales bacterium]